MDPEERIVAENAELKRHLKLLLQGTGVVLRCWREGEQPEPVFVDALEETVAKASAALLAAEVERS